MCSIQHTYMFHVFHTTHLYVPCVPYKTAVCSMCSIQHTSIFHVFHTTHLYVPRVPYNTSVCSMCSIQNSCMFHVFHTKQLYVPCVQPRNILDCTFTSSTYKIYLQKLSVLNSMSDYRPKPQVNEHISDISITNPCRG